MSAVRVGVVGAGRSATGVEDVLAALGAASVPAAGAPAGPAGGDPWRDLGGCAAVYVAGADDPELFVHARTAPWLVVSALALEPLVGSCIPADVVLVDGGDPAQEVDETELPVAPGAMVVALGPTGGWLRRADATEDRWGDGGVEGAQALGAGLEHALGAALAVGLARQRGLEAALALAAAVGAALARAGGDHLDLGALAGLPA